MWDAPSSAGWRDSATTWSQWCGTPKPQAGACHLESRCAYAMQLCKQGLESPQIESGDIVSGLTAGHQIGNQFPSHGRQCQANVLVPYRIEDRGVFETTDARKIVGKHRSWSNPARAIVRATVAQVPKACTQSRPFSRVWCGVAASKLHEAGSA